MALKPDKKPNITVISDLRLKISDAIKKDTIDAVALVISLLFLSWLFVRGTLFFLAIGLVLGIIAVIHHKHHDIIKAIWAYTIGFSMSAISLYILFFIFSLFVQPGMHITTLLLLICIPLTFVYVFVSSLIVIYFHERLLPDINYEGVFSFIFITTIIIVLFAVSI